MKRGSRFPGGRGLAVDLTVHRHQQHAAEEAVRYLQIVQHHGMELNGGGVLQSA